MINSTCAYQVDYSGYPGERILPFIFKLNQEESILYPSEGQYQTFCYDVIGVGRDSAQYVDLSHFLLGICDKITQDDIISVSVSINGVPQEAEWGKGIEIKTASQPDPTTGCVGLKVDYGLDKQNGVMKVCIVLRRAYNIGPVNICLKGGKVMASGLTICGPLCNGEGELGCDYVFKQKETVSVPVKIMPYANQGKAKVICCGEPVIEPDVPNMETQTVCVYTVTQTMCVEVPISFGAVVETGSAIIQCGDVSKSDCKCQEKASEILPCQKKNEEMKGGFFLKR